MLAFIEVEVTRIVYEKLEAVAKLFDVELTTEVLRVRVLASVGNAAPLGFI